MAEAKTKPYIKLASTLVLLGMGIFTLERYGLSQMEGPGRAGHIDGTLISALVIAPMLLILAGAVVFVVGRMRRL